METVLDSRQLRTCAVCFDLTVGLMRVSCLFLLSIFSGSVHTRPENFENAALFLRLGLPSTLIRHTNGAFRNALQTRGTFENADSSVDGEHLKSGVSRKR